MSPIKKKNHLVAELSSLLNEEEMVEFAYLFGSHSRMTQRENSDVDVGVFLSKDLTKENRFYPEELAEKLEKKIGKSIDVRVLNNQTIIFLHQVLKYATIIVNNNNQRRVRFETRVYDEYLDFKYYIDQYNKIRRRKLSS
jgi:predicted nucleotidyltransferase